MSKKQQESKQRFQDAWLGSLEKPTEPTDWADRQTNKVVTKADKRTDKETQTDTD